jgi:hypothetical protein
MSRLKVGTGPSGGYSPPSYWKEAKDAQIDPNCEESLKKWEEVLHLSRSEILAAIDDFGPVVREIRRGLLYRSQNEAA